MTGADGSLGGETAWLEGIGTVATDLAESYRAGLDNEPLAGPTRVADPFQWCA